MPTRGMSNARHFGAMAATSSAYGDAEDPDDMALRRVVLKVSRATFIQSVRIGIAVGAIAPTSPVMVKLYSQDHFIGGHTMTIKQ